MGELAGLSSLEVTEDSIFFYPYIIIGHLVKCGESPLFLDKLYSIKDSVPENDTCMNH